MSKRNSKYKVKSNARGLLYIGPRRCGKTRHIAKCAADFIMENKRTIVIVPHRGSVQIMKDAIWAQVNEYRHSHFLRVVPMHQLDEVFREIRGAELNHTLFIDEIDQCFEGYTKDFLLQTLNHTSFVAATMTPAHFQGSGNFPDESFIYNRFLKAKKLRHVPSQINYELRTNLRGRSGNAYVVDEASFIAPADGYYTISSTHGEPQRFYSAGYRIMGAGEPLQTGNTVTMQYTYDQAAQQIEARSLQADTMLVNPRLFQELLDLNPGLR